jgi:hypothetical protein
MVALLEEQVDTYAWLYLDTPGRNTNVLGHELPLREDCPPVKRKLVLKDEKVYGPPRCEQS